MSSIRDALKRAERERQERLETERLSRASETPRPTPHVPDEGGAADLRVVEPERIQTGEQGRFEAVFAEPGQDVRIVFELAWIS